MATDSRIMKSVRGVRHSLIAQFALGIGLATYAGAEHELDMAHQPVANMIVLSLHVLLALIMLVAAFRVWWLARQGTDKRQTQVSHQGLAMVGLAVVGGSLTQVEVYENLGIVLMSLGFIVAFVIYSRWSDTAKA